MPTALPVLSSRHFMVSSPALVSLIHLEICLDGEWSSFVMRLVPFSQQWLERLPHFMFLTLLSKINSPYQHGLVLESLVPLIYVCFCAHITLFWLRRFCTVVWNQGVRSSSFVLLKIALAIRDLLFWKLQDSFRIHYSTSMKKCHWYFDGGLHGL